MLLVAWPLIGQVDWKHCHNGKLRNGGHNEDRKFSNLTELLLQAL